VSRPTHYGLLAEFHEPGAVVAAAHLVHEAGHRKIDAYTPYPIEELAEAIGVHHSPLPPLILAGGILGGLAGFGLQYWSAVIAYPLNIGGRPFNSWVAFIPPTFETTVLFAAAAAVFGMIAVNGLPQPYHPVFNVPAFALASRDKCFLLVESADPKFDAQATRRLLEGLAGVSAVHEVER